ncbi:MAG: ketoacyl-ACP synthase III [Anaerolineales bacterium]|nr:ketoacyl-ACP synthase III [Anaerolineales bacterium]
MTYAHITGWGMHVPKKILTNHDLAEMVDTNDEWIRERTGIEQRHIASKSDTTASLAVEAATHALRMAKLPPTELDLIVVATSSPEFVFPSTASVVQDRLGAEKAGAFDLSAACTGFIYALNMATQAIRSGQIKSALVIGSETLSRIVDWTDRSTCILFGDGAGAFVLQAAEEPGGVLSAVMRSDGSGGSLLSIPGGGSVNPASTQTVLDGLHFIHMNGNEVFRFATRVMAAASREAMDKAGLEMDDVALIVPHQANFRIIQAAARGLKLPMERFAVNVQKYGNTSTASIPIAVCEAVEQGMLNSGDNTVMVGFGAGLTWGSLAIRWTGPFEEAKPIQVRGYRRRARLRSFLRRIWRFIEGLFWGRGKDSSA